MLDAPTPPLLEGLNGFLDALALLNDASGHRSNYRVEPLPPALDLRLALKQYFAARHPGTEAASLEVSWHIRHSALDRNWPNILRPILKHWFFEQHFSPLPIQHSNGQALVVTRFIERLLDCFGPCELHEIFVTPPIWYDSHWQDFAIVSADGQRWLLHLGFSA
ncbi:hypothetical protein [Chitinimonas lacunae]|uniref:Uncharacterized protein n=1 Tax=Chitinimonas lacunae TaxID=1963018 RepID=A0ABV8MI14_9NEIS